MKKTVLSSLILCALLLAGCGESASQPEPQATEAPETVLDAAETEEDVITPEKIIRERYQDSDSGGKTITILSPSPGEHFYSVISGDTNEIWYEAENGEVLNDAVYRRNVLTEELLNVKISPLFGGSDDKLKTTIKKTVLAGASDFDAAIGRMDFFSDAMTGGQLLNIYDIGTIDVSDSWWDHNIVDSFTLFGDRLYWLAGDFNIFDDFAVESLYFNKKICTDYSLEYPYEAAVSGAWTIDVMNGYCKTVVKDLNGDGVIKPEDDIVGHIENNDMIKHWIYAMGEKSVDISTEGELVVNTLSDRQIAAVETLFHYMVEEEMTYGNRDNPIFKIDHALFMGNMLGGINGLREMESDFGLLPMPKMDESQERYGEYVSNGWTTAIVVPIISSDPELTGTVIDAMSAFSTDTVRKALYDITLNVKLVRDEESVAALDIILDSKSYDWAVDFSWGSSFQAAYNAVYDRRQNNYVSAATKAYDKQVKTINNLLEKISALG